MDGALHVDLGRGHVVVLTSEETQRRLDATTPQWPIMHAVLHGVGRDQLMARHKANHVQVAYAPEPGAADVPWLRGPRCFGSWAWSCTCAVT